MSARLEFRLDLSKLDKTKIVQGKKGSYYPVTVWINDAVDQFGYNVSVQTKITKEESDAGQKATYIGNGHVRSSDGNIMVVPYERNDAQQAPQPAAQEADFPF